MGGVKQLALVCLLLLAGCDTRPPRCWVLVAVNSAIACDDNTASPRR